MIVDTLLVRLGGESGIDNAISAGDALTRSVARNGYHVHTFRTYPAEIKGGPVMFQLRVGIHPVASLGDQLDVLLAFNEEAWDLHHQALRPDGILIYDPGEHDAPASFRPPSKTSTAKNAPSSSRAIASPCWLGISGSETIYARNPLSAWHLPARSPRRSWSCREIRPL
jgi:Pyruvate/2-oxoacid:ferredoxin oxidoreductase gamma subunit